MNNVINELDKIEDRLSFTFKCMKIAERVINKQIELIPECKNLIFDSFQYLIPSDVLRSIKSERLYEHHCEEIIKRMINNKDDRKIERVIEDGTEAEMAAYLSLGSLSAPLDRDYTNVYIKLYNKIFPENKQPDDMGESWEGRANEITTKLRNKLKTKRN